MPNYEIAVPPGAKNVRLVYGSHETYVDWSYTRVGKDGDEIIVPLFGGDEFNGDILDGMWTKYTDGSLRAGGNQGLIARIASSPSGHLELTGAAAAAGNADFGWIVSNSKFYFGKDNTELIIELEVPTTVSATREVAIQFFILPEFPSDNPQNASNFLRLWLRNNNGTYSYYLQKKVNGTTSDVTGDGYITASNPDVKFKFVFQETDDGHTHFYVDDGETGSWTEYSGTNSSPFSLDLGFSAGYIAFQIGTNDDTERSCYVDYIRVNYPDNIKVVYDLDEDEYTGEGEELLTTAWDTSGNGNHGTVYGATWVKDGKYGKALSFDSKDDYVNCGNKASLKNMSAFTIGVWLKSFGSTGAYQSILTAYKDGENYFRMALTDAPEIRSFFRDEGVGAEGPTEPLSWNTWYHVVYVYDGYDYRLYLNGVDKGIGPISNSTTAMPDADLKIGKYTEAYPQVFNGIIDEVRIYNRALEPEEIQTLYNGGEVTDGLVGEWTFDGGNGRGEAKIWDTRGYDSDETQWQRVYDRNHSFEGDCVIENGLVRLWLDENTSAKFYFWNGKDWTYTGHLLDTVLDYYLTPVQLRKIESITTESVKVEFNFTTPDADKGMIIDATIERGKHYIELEVTDFVNISGTQKMFYVPINRRFLWIDSSHAIADYDSTIRPGAIGFPSDNFIIGFDDEQSYLQGVFVEKDIGQVWVYNYYYIGWENITSDNLPFKFYVYLKPFKINTSMTLTEDNFDGTKKVGWLLVNDGDEVYLWDENYSSSGKSLTPTLTVDKSNDKFTCEFYIDNDREESNSSLTDGQSDSNEICLYDDTETFWGNYRGGTGSYSVTVSEELTEVTKGTSSTKIEISTGGTYRYLGVAHDYATLQDWSDKEFLCLYLYGRNTGATWTVRLVTVTSGNYGLWYITDNYSGWRRFVLPLNDPDSSSGTYDLTQVDQLQIFVDANVAGEGAYYLDRTVVDVGQWTKVEAYVPDDLNDGQRNVRLYAYKPSISDYDSTAFIEFDAEDNDPAYYRRKLSMHFLDGSTMDDVYGSAEMSMYLKGVRNETESALVGNGGDITYSSYYGCLKRIGFAIKMPPDDGQDSATDGISQCKIKLEVFYENNGRTTFYGDPVLYADAETDEDSRITLSTGAEIVDVTGDYFKSVALDAQNEKVYLDLTGITDLPKGRYVALVRAKDTNNVSDDLELSVTNFTDSTYLNEENTTAKKTLTSSFAFYGVIFDVTDDEEDDTIRIIANKQLSTANTIYIDYFVIFPLGNGESWIQEAAHNALRTFTKKYKVYKR